MSVESLLFHEDATGIAEHVHKGEISPADLVGAAIARAERVNPEINAIAEPLFDAARARAERVERSAPFAGVPFAIKDLVIQLDGVPSHSGSRVAPLVAAANSTLTDHYLAAGFVPIATSTTPEYGLRLVTESEAFGATRNPWNTARTPGGSSGGAAALVAAGVVPAAHASDGGGSIRVPAACTGLVGMKPSRGRVPMTPVFSEMWFGLAIDHVLARSVRDSAAILDLTAGADPLAPYVARPPEDTFAAAAARDPGRLRIGVWHGTPLGLEVSPQTREALERAVAIAGEGEHTIEEIDLAFIDRSFLGDFARVVCGSIAAAVRAESARVGHRVSGELERATRVLSRFGGLMSGGDLALARLRLDQAAMRLLAETAGFDAVMMPLLAHPPVAVGAMEATGADAVIERLLDALHLTPLLRVDALFGQLVDKSLWFTHWPAIQNVTGQPAIALPVHVTDDGLPMGVQVAGRIGDEETLFSLAAQMERIDGWTVRRAPFHVPG